MISPQIEDWLGTPKIGVAPVAIQDVSPAQAKSLRPVTWGLLTIGCHVEPPSNVIRSPEFDNDRQRLIPTHWNLNG